MQRLALRARRRPSRPTPPGGPRLKTAAKYLHQSRVEPPAAGDQPLACRGGKMLRRCRYRGDSHLGQRGRAVFKRKSRGDDVPKIVAIERFWRRAVEERVSEKLLDMGRRGASGVSERAVEVGRGAGVPVHPIIDERVAGAGVEGEDFRLLSDPGNIRDAAEVEDRDRLRQRGDKCGMK